MGAVPDQARGPGQTAPTYVVGSRDRDSTGQYGLAAHPRLAAFAKNLPRSPLNQSSSKDRKSVLRGEALARRDALDSGARDQASERILSRLVAEIRVSDARFVSAYMPIGSEVDIFPLFAAADELGVTMALPVQSDEGLHFRAWHHGEPLVGAPFGVREPVAEAEEIMPEIIIMPLVGFDRAGQRLGYGRGHYDRTIARLHAEGIRPRLVGVAFAVQEVAAIPAETHDMPLDAIVTETGIVALERAQ